jgi:hypothetical protein
MRRNQVAMATLIGQWRDSLERDFGQAAGFTRSG